MVDQALQDGARPMDALPGDSLPVGGFGRNHVAWWGVLCLIATEASLFAYLLFSYYYIGLQYGPAWLPARHPSLMLSAPDTVVLLLSSVAVWWGEKGVIQGRRRQQLAGLAIAILLGAIFIAVQLVEWSQKRFGIASSSYGSLYYTITGFHMAHVVVGLIVLATLLGWSVAGFFGQRRHTPILIGSAYWHFVDVVWLFVFSTFYLTPYLF
ncbi:MAG TPA: cytochrome c oxidase subunit 3 [Caulobacteraceae bacterium]